MRYLGGGGQTGDFMSSFIRIPTFESFNLSFIKFLNSAEMVTDTCSKTWIQEIQSSELPKNMCCARGGCLHWWESWPECDMICVQCRSCPTLWMWPQCCTSAAALPAPASQPDLDTPQLYLVMLFTFNMVAYLPPEILKCKKYLRQNRNLPPCWCRGWCGQLVLSWGPPGPHLWPQPRPHPRYLLGSLHAEINITSLKIIILSPVRCIV